MDEYENTTESELMLFPSIDLPCPDCGKLWPDGLYACPHCELTIEEVAERLTHTNDIIKRIGPHVG